MNLDEYNLDLSSYVYCIDPETDEFAEYERLYAEENRVWAYLKEIPDHVQKAAVAIEDERYYSHAGVDFVKNLTGDSDKKVGRKIQEMIRAIQLEKKLSKDEILELYLNSFYLGQGCNGIKSASMFYFDKDVSELTIAEGACLVGITQYPTLYDPLLNPDKNKEKQELVLSKMLEHEYITKEEYKEAIEEELVFVGKANSAETSKQSYFVDEIIREVLQDLQDEGYTESVATKMLYSGGLKIYSTIDPDIQKVVDDVFSNPENLRSGSKGTPQASMTIIDPYTGEVKALVGGFGEKEGSLTLNRATGTLRQPGSTIKPIAVYAPAFENKLIEPGSVYEDKAITIGDWSPKNYYKGFKGKVSIKYAIDQSINTVPIQVLQKLGINASYDFLSQKLGVTSLVSSDRNLSSLALGGLTKGISNMELTAAYSAFVNDGVYNTPITYTKVEDANGKVILEKKSKSNVAMKTSTARLMNGLLKSVCDVGTGTPARFSSSYTIAGKTGTTDDDKDRWFVGYTPYYCAAVWVGYDTPSSLSFYSSNPTIPLWKKVMSDVHKIKKLPSKSFNYTPVYVDEEAIRAENEVEILENKVCSESGLKATGYCPTELIIDKDTSEIKDYCKIHTKETFEEAQKNENTEQPEITEPPATQPGVDNPPPLSDTGL